MPQVDVGLIISAVNNAAAGLNNVSDGVKKIGENAQATTNRLKAIQVVIAGIAIEKIRQLSDAFLKAASGAQSLELHLAAFAGGVGPASVIWNKLNAEFGATPFKVDAITSAWIKLQAVTGNSAESTKIIEAVVNAVAAMPDGTDAKIQDITTSLQRMLATGAVQGRQFKSIITDAGLTVGDLAKAAGKGTQEFTRALDDGFVNAKTLIDAFIKASNDKFGDFAIKLGSTLGGAMNKINNDFNAALGRLGERTDMNERLTSAFQNLDKAIVSFVDHLSQGDVDKFFDLLSNMVPILGALVNLVINVGSAFLSLTSVAAHFLDVLPEEAVSYGIVGYIFFGKMGGMIGGLIGLVDESLRRCAQDVDRLLALVGLVSAEWAKSDIAKLNTPTLEAITKGLSGSAGGTGGGIFDRNADQIAKIKKDLAGIANTKPSVVDVTGDTDKFIKAQEAAQRWAEKFKETLLLVNDSLDVMASKISGDELGANLGEINKKFDGWVKSIKDGLTAEKALEPPFRNNLDLETKAADEIARANTLRAQELALTKQIFAIKTQSFLIDQKITQYGIADQFAHMKQQFDTSPDFNLSAGTTGGAAQLQWMQTEFDLRTQLLTISKAQKDIDLQIMELGGPGGPNAARVEALEQTKDTYRQLSDLATQSLHGLTVEGTLAKQFWTDMGSTMHTTIADGLDGIIERTKTWGDVGRMVLSSLTKLSINYLMSLAEAKLQQSALSSGGGGGILEGIGNFIGNNIPHFANGGVVSGPTLIGEAGDEGVLPLTRIGGQLGVRSVGGGNTYHITVQAIDTQTGLQFIGQHIANIDRGLQHRRTLHRK